MSQLFWTAVVSKSWRTRQVRKTMLSPRGCRPTGTIVLARSHCSPRSMKKRTCGNCIGAGSFRKKATSSNSVGTRVSLGIYTSISRGRKTGGGSARSGCVDDCVCIAAKRAGKYSGLWRFVVALRYPAHCAPLEPGSRGCRAFGEKRRGRRGRRRCRGYPCCSRWRKRFSAWVWNPVAFGPGPCR